MYAIQLLTGDMPLATILGMSATTKLEANTTRGAKCQCHSSDLKQEEEETVEPDHTTEECPHYKWKEGRPVAKALKEPHHKAFSKESAVMNAATQAYFKTHQDNFKEEGSHDLSSTFWDMASSMNLLGTKVYEVQEEWSGCQELKTANKTAKASQRDIYFFRLVVPTESSKIMGLDGIHLPKAL